MDSDSAYKLRFTSKSVMTNITIVNTEHIYCKDKGTFDRQIIIT